VVVVDIQKKNFEVDGVGSHELNAPIAGYLTTLRHNDFLRSISPRYDYSFGFSPRMTVFCISTSGNLQYSPHHVWSLFLIINNPIMPPISFDWGVYRGEIKSLRARGASAKDI
jgi:hypothetical protein